jgi:hypothetical protein
MWRRGIASLASKRLYHLCFLSIPVARGFAIRIQQAMGPALEDSDVMTGKFAWFECTAFDGRMVGPDDIGRQY